jgi:hypothetical protein
MGELYHSSKEARLMKTRKLKGNRPPDEAIGQSLFKNERR